MWEADYFVSVPIVMRPAPSWNNDVMFPRVPGEAGTEVSASICEVLRAVGPIMYGALGAGWGNRIGLLAFGSSVCGRDRKNGRGKRRG